MGRLDIRLIIRSGLTAMGLVNGNDGIGGDITTVEEDLGNGLEDVGGIGVQI